MFKKKKNENIPYHVMTTGELFRKYLISKLPIPKRPMESKFLIKAWSGVIGKRLPKQPQFPELLPDKISIERWIEKTANIIIVDGITIFFKLKGNNSKNPSANSIPIKTREK